MSKTFAGVRMPQTRRGGLDAGRSDIGSTYTWVAAALLRTLSVVPTERRRVVTIKGQVAERDAAEVLITFEGRTLHTVCRCEAEAT